MKTKTFCFTEEDKRLYELPQIFSISSIWLEEGMNDNWATFDLVVRGMPSRRNFLVFSGFEEIIHDVLNWKYSEEEINFLKENKIITSAFEKYLRNFKFTGNVYAMPEGSIFFPDEPVVRVTAPLIEGNLLTMMMINALTSNTIFSTKNARLVLAAKDKVLIGPWGMRAHSWESSLKCARAAYMVGSTVGAPTFFRKYGIDPSKISTAIIGYHAFIKSYDSELEAMRVIAKYGGKFLNTSVMVDTYDLISGIKNAITVAKEMEAEGRKLTSITIDSGDLYENAVMGRKMLDEAGLNYVRITLAGNLDEYKIKEMVDKEVPANAFIVATEGLTVSDSPKLETVFKIAQLESLGKIKSMAKLTPGKESYPGIKNVYRKYDKDGKIDGDVIGIEGEEDQGKPLLVSYIENGKLVREMPHLDEIRNYCIAAIKEIPESYLSLDKKYKYKVTISEKLKKLLEDVKTKHLGYSKRHKKV